MKLLVMLKNRVCCNYLNSSYLLHTCETFSVVCDVMSWKEAKTKEHDFLSMGKSGNKKKATPSKSKTLFIRNLPFTLTNDKLTDVFKDYGPINMVALSL